MSDIEDKDKPCTNYEFAAWDRYASAFLVNVGAAHVTHDANVERRRAELAGRYADAMLAERRKRYHPL